MIECKDLLFRKSQWELFSDLILITDNKLITNESIVWFAKRTSESFGHESIYNYLILFCFAVPPYYQEVLTLCQHCLKDCFFRSWLAKLSHFYLCFFSLAFPSLTQSTNVSQFTCKSHLFPKLFITDSTACVRRYVFVCRSAGYSALIEARCPF